jgi:hypothetical protein
MSSKHRSTPEQAVQAVECLLDALATGSDIFDALDLIGPLHPKNNTFPGEVFMRLAARALAEGGVSPGSPISQEGLMGRYLAEATFNGRQNQKFRYAVLVAAATHAGVEVDLLVRSPTATATTSGATAPLLRPPGSEPSPTTGACPWQKWCSGSETLLTRSASRGTVAEPYRQPELPTRCRHSDALLTVAEPSISRGECRCKAYV